MCILGFLEFGNVLNMGIYDFDISKFQNFEIPRFQNFQISKFPNFQIPIFPDFQIPKIHWDPEIVGVPQAESPTINLGNIGNVGNI